jgi:hypothetical protein
MEATYLDFRYLQLKKTPSSFKCAVTSLIAGIALSLPYLLQLILGLTPYFQIQPYQDGSGIIRVHSLINNPFGFDFSRYLNYGFKMLAVDFAIFLVTIILWTVAMSFVLNDGKKRWQLFPVVISIGFTLPVIVFTFSIFGTSKTFLLITSLLNNPLSIYGLLTIALGIVFGLKKLMHLLIPGLIGYYLGYIIIIFVVNQINNSQFDNFFVPTEKIINWLTIAQISRNLIWNFFVGIGVYATYAESRKLSQSLARFDDDVDA